MEKVNKKLTLINHLSDQIPAFFFARTYGLRVYGNFSQMFEIIQLQNKFQMSERLNERNHGEVVLCGPHLWSISSKFYEQHLHAHIPKVPKRQSSCQSFLNFWDLRAQKLCIER
jgi:hypothetical protein